MGRKNEKKLKIPTYQTTYEKLEKVIELLSQYNPVHLESSNPTRLPRQNDYRTFCMSDETEKVYQKLEKITELLSQYTLLRHRFK